MFIEHNTYVVANTVPQKRTGQYLLIVKTVTATGITYVAFGLSHADALRAQHAGAGFSMGDDAAKLIRAAVTD